MGRPPGRAWCVSCGTCVDKEWLTRGAQSLAEVEIEMEIGEEDEDMKRDKAHRNPKAKHVPHVDEHKNDDGSVNMQAVEQGFPEVMDALKTGKVKLLDMVQTEPDANGEDWIMFRRRHAA